MPFIYVEQIQGGGPDQFFGICEETSDRTAAASTAVTTAQGMRVRFGVGSIVKDLEDGGVYVLDSAKSWKEVP